MNKYTTILLSTILLISFACSKSTGPGEDESVGSVYIYNQGGFNRGEASISVYDIETGTVRHNAFFSRNGRPLGDVFQSAVDIGDHLFLVINNSKKIEVVDPQTLASIRTLTLPAHISPRYLTDISPDEGYLTSLYTNYIYRINLVSGVISDSVDVGAGSEGIVTSNNRVFAALNLNPDFSAAQGVAVVSVADNTLEKIIPTLPGASVVIKTENEVWVNSTGEWAANNGGVTRINSITGDLLETIELNASTSGIAYSHTADELYILSDGIIKYNINTGTKNKISNRNYYGINVYEKDEIIIYASDAKNYSDDGVVLVLKSDGTVLDSIAAGIIPFGFRFE